MQIRQFEARDAHWVVAQHQHQYARTEGFDATFGPLVAEIVSAHVAQNDPSCEAGWIAEVDGAPVGSIFCMRKTMDMAQLRLFLVLPEARGQGVGRALLRTCITFASDAGYGALSLWTHAEHEAACKLYAENGFFCGMSLPVRAFGRDLTEQIWHLEL